MGLSKKTTILFPHELHARLVRLARQRGTSLGELVRAACEKQYGLVSEEDRLEALRRLSGSALPAADPATMNEESTPTTEELLELDHQPARKLEEIFSEYTDEFEFSRTRIMIKLFEIGVRFVSRSEGKRLMRGLERFREIVLDFSGVEGVGQGFADEVFRVWAHDHPHVTIVPVHMNDSVRFMVERARASG